MKNKTCTTLLLSALMVLLLSPLSGMGKKKNIAAPKLLLKRDMFFCSGMSLTVLCYESKVDAKKYDLRINGVRQGDALDTTEAQKAISKYLTKICRAMNSKADNMAHAYMTAAAYNRTATESQKDIGNFHRIYNNVTGYYEVYYKEEGQPERILLSYDESRNSYEYHTSNFSEDIKDGIADLLLLAIDKNVSYRELTIPELYLFPDQSGSGDYYLYIQCEQPDYIHLDKNVGQNILQHFKLTTSKSFSINDIKLTFKKLEAQ